MLLLRLTTITTIVIEHSQSVILVLCAHFDLARILESQVLLSLSLTILAKCAIDTSHHVRLLLVVVMMRFWTVSLILSLLLLQRQLRLRLINILVRASIFRREIFVIIINDLIIVWIIEIEMLPSIKWTTLISLISLWKLFLGRHIKVALSNGKFFHVTLRIHILNTLIYIVYGTRIFLVLWLR